MGYSRREVDAPRSAGASLAFLAFLAENPLTAGLVAGMMFPKVGITHMRAAGALESAVYRLPGHAEVARNLQCWRSEPPVADARAVAASFPQPGRRFPLNHSAQYVEAYRSGTTTPVEVATRFTQALEASDRSNPPMRFLVAHNAEDLLAQATQSAARYREGCPLSPLDGVPVAVKDEMDLAGYGTTVGTSFLGKQPAEHDAACVARLRRAGALLVGKANMHEIGIGVTGLNPHHGTARNPFDPSRATGGSSSGSAAIVSSGLCPIAVGADGGGSIRIPAALCGALGLKPTFGRVSETGVAPVCWSVAHAGPIASCTRDLALGLAYLSGGDQHDPFASSAPPLTLTAPSTSLAGIKIGIYWPWFNDATEEVVARCSFLLNRFVESGAKVHQVEVPHLDLVGPVHLVSIVSEMAAAFADHYGSRRKEFGLDTRLNLALGRRLTAIDFVNAQRLRNRIRTGVDRVLEHVDLIVTPTTGITAPQHQPDALPRGESDLSKTFSLMRFVQLANLTGYPAISIPTGYDSKGLPVGLQAMGRAWDENLLLRLAMVAETEVERTEPAWHASALNP